MNNLTGKKLLLDDMGISYDEYLRNSWRLTGLELELIRDRVTPNQAKTVVNEVHDSFQSWLSKARACYKFRPVAEDKSLQGTVLILEDLELIGRDNSGFDEVMDARTREEGIWDHNDYKLLLRYANENIESVDVGTIADQEEVNMEKNL